MVSSISDSRNISDLLAPKDAASGPESRDQIAGPPFGDVLSGTQSQRGLAGEGDALSQAQQNGFRLGALRGRLLTEAEAGIREGGSDAVEASDTAILAAPGSGEDVPLSGEYAVSFPTTVEPGTEADAPVEADTDGSAQMSLAASEPADPAPASAIGNTAVPGTNAGETVKDADAAPGTAQMPEGKSDFPMPGPAPSPNAEAQPARGENAASTEATPATSPGTAPREHSQPAPAPATAAEAQAVSRTTAAQSGLPGTTPGTRSSIESGAQPDPAAATQVAADVSRTAQTDSVPLATAFAPSTETAARQAESVAGAQAPRNGPTGVPGSATPATAPAENPGQTPNTLPESVRNAAAAASKSSDAMPPQTERMDVRPAEGETLQSRPRTDYAPAGQAPAPKTSQGPVPGASVPGAGSLPETVRPEAAQPGIEADQILSDTEIGATSAARTEFSTELRTTIVHPRPVAADGVAREVLQAALSAKGNTTLELRLDPAELGKVDIELTFADDRLNIAVRAERDDALDLMRRHSDEFVKMLRSNDLDLDTLSFSQGQGRDRGAAQSSTPVAIRDFPAGSDEIAPAHSASANSTRLDMRV